MLLDGRTWAPANRIDQVLADAPDELRSHLSAETHACMVELVTSIHGTVAEAAMELAELRRALDRSLSERHDLRAAVAGTHPSARAADVRVSPFPRYADLHADLGALARREPTMALHVHVAVPDGEAGVRALDGVRSELALLLALSTNSPFWRGEDTGLASMRALIFAMFPRTGTPRAFTTYESWIDGVGALLASGALQDPSFLWWDVRLRPSLGTVEVRIMDAQTHISETAAIAALVQCLVRRYAEEGPPPCGPFEVLDENRFRAARDGADSTLIDHRTGSMRPIRDVLAETVGASMPLAVELGCARELAIATRIALLPGHRRQIELADRHGINGVVACLADEFTPDHAGPRAGLT